MKLTLVTPEKKIVTNLPIVEVTLPGHMGELNILPGHSPMMTSLGSGILRYKTTQDEVHKLAVSWGYCDVNGETVSVLAEVAQKQGEIDLNELKKSQTEVEKKLSADFMEESVFTELSKKVEELRTQYELAHEKENH